MARDLDHMARALRAHLEGDTAIRRIVPLSTGHSNETYLLEGPDRILRMPPSAEGLLPPYDMARQHAILHAIGRSPGGPPVPRVYEYVADASVIGDPFFLMEHLDGEAFEYAVPDWLAAAPPSLRGDMARQWVGAMAAVHCLPASTMPPPVRTVQDEIGHWREVAAQAQAKPALHALLEEIQAHPPRLSGAVTPLHGDPKQGNCLWSRAHRGQLLALLDWEMAGVGEPLTDLGYLLQWYDQGEAALASAGLDLPGWWPRERMIEEWERITGRRALDVRLYETLAMCKIAAIIAKGFHLFRSGRTQDERFEAWGDLVPRYVALARRRSEMA